MDCQLDLAKGTGTYRTATYPGGEHCIILVVSQHYPRLAKKFHAPVA